MASYTRWYLFIALVLVLVLTSVIWIALGVLIPAPPTRITIAGSFSGGHFEALAQRYQEILARNGPQGERAQERRFSRQPHITAGSALGR